MAARSVAVSLVSSMSIGLEVLAGSGICEGCDPHAAASSRPIKTTIDKLICLWFM
jgi:hypothetical protein